MTNFAATTPQTRTPNAIRASSASALPSQQGLSLAELISSGAYRMVVGIERLVTRH